jgi:hypothetical protein
MWDLFQAPHTYFEVASSVLENFSQPCHDIQQAFVRIISKSDHILALSWYDS